jgi:hypothetical protein
MRAIAATFFHRFHGSPAVSGTRGSTPHPWAGIDARGTRGDLQRRYGASIGTIDR